MSWIQDSAVDFKTHTTSLLVGDSLLYFLSDQGTIIEYDLAEGDTTTMPAPLEFDGNNLVALILTEDGGLGVAESFSDSGISIWSMLVSDDNDVVQWVRSWEICLDNFLPAAALNDKADEEDEEDEVEEIKLMSFVERANVLFIRTPTGIFTIELQSERVRKVCEDDDSYSLVPIEDFYTPWASRREYTTNDVIGLSSC